MPVRQTCPSGSWGLAIPDSAPTGSENFPRAYSMFPMSAREHLILVHRTIFRAFKDFTHLTIKAKLIFLLGVRIEQNFFPVGETRAYEDFRVQAFI